MLLDRNPSPGPAHAAASIRALPGGNRPRQDRLCRSRGSTMTIQRPLLAFLLVLSLSAAGCERSTEGLSPAPPNTDPVVFMDDFGESVNWASFNPAEGADVNALATEFASDNVYEGIASLRITVRPGFMLFHNLGWTSPLSRPRRG